MRTKTCDGKYKNTDCNCSEWFLGLSRLVETKIDAQKKGWLITKKGDFCPKCKERMS